MTVKYIYMVNYQQITKHLPNATQYEDIFARNTKGKLDVIKKKDFDVLTEP